MKSRPVSGRSAVPLALLSSVLVWLCFPGQDWWPLAFLWWIPLILAVRGQTPSRALLVGWLFGLVGKILCCSWLLPMLRNFSGFSLPVCVLLMVLFCAYQGGRFALMMWLVARAERNGWPFGLALALAFAAHEMVYPLLFPWYMGVTVHNVPLLMQLAEVGGMIGVGLALLGSSYFFAELVRARRVSWLALLGPVLLVVYGAVRLPMVDRAVAAAPAATIGIVQGNLPLGNREPIDSAAIQRNLTDRLESQGKMDLVVWSEDSLKFGIPHESLGAVLAFGVLRGAIETPVLAGTTVLRDNERFNTAVLFRPDGRVEGVYDKTYLLAFGEYIPFGDMFPVLYEISKNSSRFRAGTRLDSIPFGEHRITVLICYEDILPVFANRLVRHGDPDLLVNMTNDAWFGRTTEPAIHLALAKFRSVEHRRFLVRATNSGISAFVDPNGRAWGETPLFEEATRVGQVRWMRARTPYELWGNLPWWLGTVAILAMAVVRRRKEDRGVDSGNKA